MILQGKILHEFLPLGDLYTIYQDHKRLGVFAKKGRKCVSCDCVGTLLVTRIDRGRYKKHVDLYTDDLVLMTVDHIIPMSISGDDSLDNKQPMCDPCNNSKGNKLLTNEELAERRKNAQPKLAGVEIIRELIPNIHRIHNDEVWLGR